jgi:hypothetical protein
MPDAEKLRQLALTRLQEHIDDDFFDYHNWDDLIEVDKEITGEDLDWMRENVRFKVEIVTD